MAIFTRRSIQAMLDQSADYLTPQDIDTVIGLLDNPKHALATEWELAILHGLSKQGRILHESKNGGSSCPDIEFYCAHSDKPLFVADVRAVSDAGRTKDNPVERFIGNISREIKKFGLSLNKFDIRVNGKEIRKKRMVDPKDGLSWKLPKIGPGGRQYGMNSKMTIPIPSGQNLRRFTNEVRCFLGQIKTTPDQTHSMSFKNEAVDAHIRNNPRQDSFTHTHPSYRVTKSLSNNPIANALERKHEQLREHPFDGPKGIILCDAGCQLFQDGRNGGTNYELFDIVHEYFRQTKGIAFVLAIFVKSRYTPWAEDRAPRIECGFYWNDLHGSLPDQNVATALESMVQHIPLIEQDPENAQRYLDHNRTRFGRKHLILRMTMKSISLSSRALQELLAGVTGQKEFLETHENMRMSITGPDNLFQIMLNEGRLIQSVKVERNPDKDDDILTFEFTVPDAAASRFVNRNRKGSKITP